MATQGPIETFRSTAAGGSPYAPAYADEFRERQFGNALRMAEEQRAQESFDLQKQREALQEKKLAAQEQRNQMLDDLRLRSSIRQDESEALKIKRDNDKESMMNLADSVISQIEDVDPLHKDSRNNLDKIRQTQEYHRVMTNRNTRDAILSSFKNKNQEIADVIGGIRHEAKSKYNIDVDPSTLKTDEDGRYDTQYIYSSQLPQMAEEATIKSQQAYESAGNRPGYIKYQEMDEYGSPVVK